MAPTTRLLREPKSDLMRAAAAQVAPPPSAEQIARDRLQSVITGLAMLHLLAAAAYVPNLQALPFVFSSPEPNPVWPALSAPVVALVSGIFLLVLRLLLPRLPLRWADPLGAFVATLTVLNCLCGLALANAPERAFPVALAVVCSGFFLFSLPWLGLVGCVAGGGWLLVAWLANFPSGWRYCGAIMAGAIGLAFLLQRLQLLSLRRILRAANSAGPDEPAASPIREDAEDRFQRWYEATFEGIAIHEKGTIIEANPMLGKLIGCDAGDLAGKNLLDWFTLASRSLVEDSILLGNYRPFEAVIQRSDKTEVPLELFSKKLPYKGRQVMVTAFRDMTERQRAASALQAEQQRLERQYHRQTAIATIEFNVDQAQALEAVLQSITQAVALHLPAAGGACLILCQEDSLSLAAAAFGEKLREAEFSPGAQLAEVTGWIIENKESFVASNAMHDDPFHVNELAPLIGAYVGQPLIEQGKVIGVLFALEEAARQFKSDDLDFLSTLGDRAAVMISKVRLYEELRRANKLLKEQSAALIAKNQELAQAKEAAETANQTKGAFLATVSHELRTPLNGVLGMTSILQQTELNPEQQDYLETLHSSAEGLLKSINQILDFIALDSSDTVSLLTAFDVRDTVTHTVEQFREKSHDRPIRFHAVLPTEFPARVRGNEAAFQQVLLHLLDNAVKFTERGEIAVGAARDSEANGQVTLKFTVVDTGIGIPADAQRRLFNSFTQADGSDARRYGGLGLGLAISKQLVDRLGGTIGVDSVVGQGSTFWFTVPFEKA